VVPPSNLIAWNRWPHDSQDHIRHEIRVMDTLGASARKIVGAIAAPSWSPDGRWLVFSNQVSGAVRLFVFNVDGSGLRQLTRQTLRTRALGT
jgi:Tol biopolymer transport system component